MSICRRDRQIDGQTDGRQSVSLLILPDAVSIRCEPAHRFKNMKFFTLCNHHSVMISLGLLIDKDGAVAQRVARRNCDQQVVGSNPTRGKAA